ncbi:hypothetical protein NQ317_011533 [Molorchus minor]|uniref:Uncharacterized protein n=1 Tax=Molorchus minor TaxID=1323400 RepID=A0ABQ9K6C2_9CUCU|nr:hypothetical protein NQ317_011533 [Molorchus minor]
MEIRLSVIKAVFLRRIRNIIQGTCHIEKSSKKLHLLKIQFRLGFKSESIKLSHSNHNYNY